MDSGMQQLDRFFKLTASVVTLVINGKRNLVKVNGALQSIVNEAQVTFELYLHDKQKNDGMIKGFDLEKHLEETKRIDRCLSLEDEVVKGWIANPSTYPEEFKDKAVFLWKSKRASASNRFVAYFSSCRDVVCLGWVGGCVIVHRRWLGHDWNGDDPAVLASSSTP